MDLDQPNELLGCMARSLQDVVGLVGTTFRRGVPGDNPIENIDAKFWRTASLAAREEFDTALFLVLP